ncbi:MAG: hypothetical protein M1824_004973 [Vezdaea acicularis]|nr:MAG: hypothetical protein M1824_004973 [Vezdaea acicularis]
MADTVLDTLQTLAGNAKRNIDASVSHLGAQDYIRIVIIIGAYALLRPYLIKLGARFQAKDHEREVDLAEFESEDPAKQKSLRSQVEVPSDSEDEDDGKGPKWGRGARRRQRAMIRKLLEEDERRKQEEADADSDKDIEDLLIKD